MPVKATQPLKDQTSPAGQAFRLGGDEFLVLLPIQDEDEAAVCLERLRLALTEVDTGDGALSGSFGTAFYPREGRDLWELMGLADGRMYQEKLGHNNRRSSSTLRAPTWLEDGF